MKNEPNEMLAAFYIWLRDAATDEQVRAWAARRKTALAADRICITGIDYAGERHPLDVISDPKGLAIVPSLQNLRAAP